MIQVSLSVCVCAHHISVDADQVDEEFMSVLTELLFELHIAATPDKLNKVKDGHNTTLFVSCIFFGIYSSERETFVLQGHF